MKTIKFRFIALLVFASQTFVSINAINISKAPIPVPLTAPGNCLLFNGSTNYISFESSSTLNSLGVSGFTLEAWVYLSTSSGVNSIIRKTGDYNLYINNGKLCAEVWQLGVGNASMKYINGTTNIPLNIWVHVSATWNGSIGALYINGSNESSSISSGNVSNSENLFIGKSSIYSQFFNGKIDELRIWNSCLTQATIQANMYNVVSASSSNLAGYWNFDASSGTSLTDITSNGNNGTLVNSPSWTESYAMVVPIPAAATDITDVSFTANWSAPAVGLVESYKLYVSTSPNFSNCVTGYNGLDCGTNLSQTVSGLAPNINYYYRILANKASVTGTSGYFRTTGAAKTVFDMNPYGNESWIGYVYTNANWNGSNPTFTGAVLKGIITQTANFNCNWGGSGPVLNSVTYNDHFLIRFKMKKYFVAGRHNISLSGDDGFRLIIDNGDYQCMDWSIHASSTRSMQLNITEAGYKYLDMEFYEHEGGAWVSFSTEKACDPPANPKDIVITNNLMNTTASWNANGNASDVTYDWYLYGDRNDYKNGSTSQTNVVLNNLDENQNYNFYVRATKTCSSDYISSSSFTQKYLKLTTTKNYLTSTSITCGGLIEYQGNETITERGVCWGTSPNPTTSNNKKTIDNNTNRFETIVDNLTGNDIYFFRAYIIVASETIYGNEVYLLPGCNIQTDVISISSNSTVTSGGYISVPQGIEITERGVCWDTNPNPTILNSITSDGNGNGDFSSSLAGLTNDAKYYVRAYAIINNTAFYGNETSFTHKSKQYQANGGYFDGEVFYENGTYNEQTYFSGSYGDDLAFYGDYWYISGWIISYSSGNPPLTDWDDGTVLTPIVLQKSTVTFSKISLKEAACNDGSIKETVTITHDNVDNATFAGTNNEDFVAIGKAIVRNLPAGLTAKIIRTSSLSLTLSITGKATAHVNANDVSNVKIMFVPDAFTDGSSMITNNNVSTISLDFIEPIDMTVTGTKTCADYSITADNNLTLDNNSTLTINSVTSANQITLNPGAKLNLSNSVTVGDVVLKADDSNSFSAKLSTCMTVNGTVTFQKTMLDSKWYFLSFPCDVNVADIVMIGGGILDTDFYILTYDGAKRATNGLDVNWSRVTTGALEAKKGYAFGLKTGIGNKTLSFVLDKTIAECETDATVPATFYDGSLGNNHKGWNLIGQPYLSKFSGADVGINYITTWNGSAYVGQAKNLVGSLNPFEAFFVQVSQTSPISFSLAGRQAIRSAVTQNSQESIQLNISNTSGVDFSTLVFDNELSSEYEIGHDLEKWVTTTIAKPQIYSVLNDIKYAYNALPISSASNLPVGYFSKTGGASTISASNVNVAGLSKLLLLDNKTGVTTDLLTESYNFNADAGTNNSRFSIIPQRISTATEEYSADRKPIVSVVGSKVIISNLSTNAVIRIYDATGKQLLLTKANETNRFETELRVAGIYILRVDVDLLKNYYKFAIK